MNIQVELVANINPGNKRIALMYYQHDFNDYQYYEVLSDGAFVAIDTPVAPTKIVQHSSLKTTDNPFKYQYKDGLLVVNVEQASWFLAVLSIVYPGCLLRKRYLLYTTRTDYEVLEKEIIAKLKTIQ